MYHLRSQPAAPESVARLAAMRPLLLLSASIEVIADQLVRGCGGCAHMAHSGKPLETIWVVAAVPEVV